MADVSNWLGDLWDDASGAPPQTEEPVYNWADDDVLEDAFAKASKPKRRSAPTAMAELSAAARRPTAPTAASSDSSEVAPPEPEPAPTPEPAARRPSMGGGQSRADDDILPTRRPSGGRLVAFRMSLTKSR
jgi:hypothetical protein